jgi:signal transduction histidine kinase
MARDPVRPFVDPARPFRYNQHLQGQKKRPPERPALRRPLFNLCFRTRLALVMFLTMGGTSGILMLTYVYHNRLIKAYVAGQTSDFLQVIQLTQTRMPPAGDRKQALDAYLKVLSDAGLSSITLASPTGEVVASTTPGQVGKKIKLKKRRVVSKESPIQISAELRDIDVETIADQKPYVIEFPIVQGDKVLGYAQVRWSMDEVGELLGRLYVVRLLWILATMLAGMFAVVYLAFRFTKPVEMLVSGAQQVAQGNLYVSLPFTGRDEMGRLAGTFNRMVERLRENRELQERLNEAEKTALLGRFAATVAHEVRNSLNFINLSIDQIRAKHLGGDERTGHELQRNLRNIKDEISRLNRLVNDFLAAGRQAPPELAPCDLAATLVQAVALVEKQATRQAIAIIRDLPSDLPILQADGAQMKTCFLNILTNAIQAMPQGGEIHVAAGVDSSANGGQGAVQVRFADTGPGIPLEDREKIFAPFYSTKATGFGLGLAITRKIVEDHGGRIYVTESAGPGTVIVVELPLTVSLPSQPAVAQSSTA